MKYEKKKHGDNGSSSDTIDAKLKKKNRDRPLKLINNENPELTG
jgi:hypothetical protein